MDRGQSVDMSFNDLMDDGKQIDLYPNLTGAVNNESDFDDLFKTGTQDKDTDQEREHMWKSNSQMVPLNWPQIPTIEQTTSADTENICKANYQNPGSEPREKVEMPNVTREEIFANNLHDARLDSMEMVHDGILRRMLQNGSASETNQSEITTDNPTLTKKLEEDKTQPEKSKTKVPYHAIEIPVGNDELGRKILRSRAKKRYNDRIKKERATILEENLTARKTIDYLLQKNVQLENELYNILQREARREIEVAERDISEEQ